jgi:hypothetical protein
MPKRKPSADAVKTIVVISDSHTGCKLGLCHPSGATLDDGGRYLPSTLQLAIWMYWESFWREWVPHVTHGEPYAVVHNGDAIDGTHHGATTQWSHNLEDQGRHAYDILKPIVDGCEGRYYHIRGTEAHVGKSAIEEERLAAKLGAIPNEQGQHARYELWTRLGGHLVHFLHHIGTTSSSAHETSAINAELAAMYTDAGRWKQEAPRVIVRSHRHRNAEIRLPTTDGYATCFVTACWQAKTPYAWKIAGARVTQPQFGGSIIRVGDEDSPYTRHRLWNLARSPEVRL